MKREDFKKEVRKLIANKEATINSIQADIQHLEAEIADLQQSISSFTDVTDLKAYTELKNMLEIRQNKLEVLKRSLANETNTAAGATQAAGADEITTLANQFKAEKKKLDEEYAPQMLEHIRALDKILKEVSDERAQLKDLCEAWVSTFKLPPSYYNTVDILDSTGTTAGVQQFINNMRALGKI